jgi:tetratricopeptide (TPR) repeat protein
MPAKKDDMYGMDFDPRTSALITFTARYALEMHRWSDAASLAPVPGAETGDNSITYWARAIGAARTGNLADARKDVAEIEAIHSSLVKQKKPGFADAVEQDRQEAAAWVAYAEGNKDEAIKALRAVAQKEEAEGDEPLAIPAREMLADMTLEMNHPEQALAEYEADLKFNPNRFNGLYGAARAAEMAGKSEKSNAYYARLVKVCDGSNSARPELSRAKSLLAQK